METLILVGVGGSIGALLRFSFSKVSAIQGIPLGTLLVNLIGSFAFSLLVFSREPGDLYYLIGVGGLGGFTTFSTFSYESFRMLEDHDYRSLVPYMAVSIGGCLLAVIAGYILCGGIL